MKSIGNPYIKLKEKVNKNDYDDINNLQKFCLETDKATLKLELDYKLNRAMTMSEESNNINEFMYYDENKLIGYIGICHFGGDALEVNGMVHPEYRRRGIFKRLFSLVKDECSKRDVRKMLLLSDNKSDAGLGFINFAKAEYDHSEYEMHLRSNMDQDLRANVVALRKAVNKDAREIAWQNSVYFESELKEEDIMMPEEEEKCGMLIYMAEVNNRTVGKVHLETGNAVCGIYGLGVLPEYRRSGYGREILNGAVEILKRKNPKDIMLQVAATNKTALNIYKSCGFEETSTMDYYRICKNQA